MTNEELQAALLQAGVPAYYDVAADISFVIIDGAFTLEELAAMGDVALKAMQNDTSDCAMNLCDPNGAHESGCHLSWQNPKVGARIRITADSMFAKKGEFGELTCCDSEGDWWFRNSQGGHVCLAREWFEVIR